MKKYRASLGVPITGGLTEAVTAWTGATLLVELYRKVGIEAAVEQTLPRKKSPKGLRREIETLPQDAWKLWKEEKRGMIREWLKYPTCLAASMRGGIASPIDTWP